MHAYAETPFNNTVQQFQTTVIFLSKFCKKNRNVKFLIFKQQNVLTYNE